MKIILLISIKSSPVDRFWCLRQLNNHINIPNRIESFASSATALMVAKNGTKNLSQPFVELKDLNLTLKLFTPKSTTLTYFETNLSRFDFEVWPMAAIFNF